MRMSGQTVLVTGATSGIGLALSEQLLARGNTVLAWGRNRQALAALEDTYPHQVHAYMGDLSVPGQAEQLADTVAGKHPELSVLVNNAGVQHLVDFTASPYALIRDRTIEELQLNQAAPILITALLLPVLARQAQAAIVNITSGLALSPKKSAPVYCATKAAMRSFSKSLRYQLSDSGSPVRLFEALPPLVDTPMTQGRGSGKISPQAAAAAIIRGIENDTEEIYVGKSQLLRVVHRVAPGVAERILRNW